MSNDIENSALITGIKYILKYITIENGYFIYNNISQLFFIKYSLW